MQSKSKKVFVKTYGCQMNVYDSDRMLDTLTADGYTVTQDLQDADLIMLNTCHIREKAAEKVYSEIGRLRKLKNARTHAGKTTLIGVTGCVAQAEGAEIITRAPEVDFVVGPQAYHRLPTLVKQASVQSGVIDIDFPSEDKFQHLPNPSKSRIQSRGVTAFLTVQEGCDKFCTFCVVPYTRGSENSRPSTQIIEEARGLVAAGVREITLLGQNVNAWHSTGPNGKNWGLGHLLTSLSNISGLERLRYTTSHPRDMDDALIAAHRDLPKLMPYLHLPVQSGSDKMLKAMNRRHTHDDYLRLIDRIRTARPDIALSGDFIVGFPGETDRDFEDTLDLVKKVGYAQAYSFKYSERPGTPAAEIEQQVPESIKKERLEQLQKKLQNQQYAFNQSQIGQNIPILIEKPGRLAGQVVGRSPWLQPVHMDAPNDTIGTIVMATIIEANATSLSAVTTSLNPPHGIKKTKIYTTEAIP